MNDIEMYIDGACEPMNPGGTAAWGAYIKQTDGSVIEGCGIVGEGALMSNNVAEYAALLNGLRIVKMKFGPASGVKVFSDSQLVVNQMNRLWEIKKGLYTEMAQRCLHFATQFPMISYTWIPRERNTFADALSRMPYTEMKIRKTPWKKISRSLGEIAWI